MISVSGILLLTFCLFGSSKSGKYNYHFINKNSSCVKCNRSIIILVVARDISSVGKFALLNTDRMLNITIQNSEQIFTKELMLISAEVLMNPY